MLSFDKISNIVLYSTVRIETDCGYGTGFIFVEDAFGPSRPLLITNKHVIEEASTGKISFHRRKNAETLPMIECYDEVIPEFKSQWIYHPNEEIDLCAMPLWPIFEKMRNEGKSDVLFAVTTSTQIPDEDALSKLSVLERVAMFGYPNGLFDEVHNFPIVREGATATHPNINFNGRPEFVVDMACFPGSSGSPILLWDVGNLLREQKVWLLGVLYAGPVMQINGSIERQAIPTKWSSNVQSEVMIHLGYAIHAREVSVLARHALEK